MKRIALLSLFRVATALVTPRSGSDNQLIISDLVNNVAPSVEEITVDVWQSIQAATARAVRTALPSSADLEDLVLASWLQGKDKLDDGAKVAEGIFADLAKEIKEASSTWPDWPIHPAPPPLDLKKYTIGQILNWTLHLPPNYPPEHHLPIRKLAFLVNISTSARDLLHDPKADITLFAPDDRALTPPSHRGPHHGVSSFLDADVTDAAVEAPFATHAFWDAQAEMQAEACPHHRLLRDIKRGDDDKRRERRRKIFLHILEVVLRYHVSPGAKTLPDILDSSTLGTALHTSSAKNATSFRIRVGNSKIVPFHSTNLNFFSKLNSRRIDTKNGAIYLIENAPLLPPLTALSMLYLFPNSFSTLTGGIAKSSMDTTLLPSYGQGSVPILESYYDTEGVLGGLDEVDSRVSKILADIIEEKKKFTVKPFTIFAPTNRAFSKLGMPINAFLFSPWGTHVLRYVLSYHVVPGVVFHTDHITNTTSYTRFTERDTQWFEDVLGATGEQDTMADFDTSNFRGPFHGQAQSYQADVTHYSFPTLLGSKANQSLAVDVFQYRIPVGKGPLVRRVVIRPPSHKNGPPPKPVPVILADAVAWSGAIHTIPNLIRPPYPSHMEHRHNEMSVKSLEEMWGEMWQ